MRLTTFAATGDVGRQLPEQVIAAGHDGVRRVSQPVTASGPQFAPAIAGLNP